MIKYSTCNIYNEDINIYRLYIDVKNSIVYLRRELKKAVKELDFAIGGPQDVKAQTYDKVGFASYRVSGIRETYKQITEIMNSIKRLENELKHLMKTKRKLEATFKEASIINSDNLELKVFVGYYIDNKSLKELSYELSREDTWGRKRKYTYQYLREINVKIKNIIEKDSENLQSKGENLQKGIENLQQHSL